MLRLLALLFLVWATPAAAQSAPDVLQQRADQIVQVIKGQADPATVFAPAFLAQVPPAQIQAISSQLQAGNGAVQRVERIERDGPRSGTVHIGFERAVVAMRLGVEEAPPHLVSFLQVTGGEQRGTDSAQAIVSEMRALPGQVSFQIARLGDGVPVSVAALEPDRALAIGSAFKLVILAELNRQIGEGRRRWDEVVAVDRHSLPSGILQDWPLGSPATVHTLAALMISRSDNTATDVLLHLLGRENVERMMSRIGMASAPRNRPFLATIEAFQIKGDSDAARSQWIAASERERRALLTSRYGGGGPAIDIPQLMARGPTAIDSVEWFASAADLVRIMDWLRRHGDDRTRAVLAISPGMDARGAGAYSYVGYKGGSEPGVINLTYLIRNNAGVWHVVTGSWNDPAAAVDEARFAGLMARAVRLVR